MVTGTEKLSNNWAETTKKISTEEQLKKLKEEIEGWKFNFEIIKWALDNLPEWDNKAFVLGAIFSWLNKLWISIERINNGKITLRLWKQNIKWNLNIASYEEAVRYETILNSNFKSWKISHSDIVKAQMYRTWTIDDYIEEVWVENTSTWSYVERLLNKHNIKVLDWNISNITEFKSEEEYNHLINTIKVMVKDSQADREFLVNYFEYIKINNKKPLDEWEIKNYKRTSDKIENGILNELESLTPEQKWSLWIWSKEEAKEVAAKFKNNPIDAVLDTFNNWGGALWLVLGIIWAIFFGKNWALGWFLAGMWIVWGSEFAWWLWEKLKWNNPVPTGSPETQINTIYGKIKFDSVSNNTKKLELQRIWWELSINNDFLNAPTTILSIFESIPAKSFEEIKTRLEAYWITITEENQEYYKNVFYEILKQRKDAIWEPQEDETIKVYLERTSTTAVATTVAGWVTSWAVANKPWETVSDIINSPYSSTFTYKIVDGKTYFIWENGEYLIQENHLTPESKEILKKYEKIGILNEILQIWLPHAEKEASSLLFKGIRTGTTIIPESIKNINSTFEQLFLKAQNWENIDNDINTIWQEIAKAENATSIIWSSDMEKVKRIFNSSESKDQKLLQIYNAMRYGWWSGNIEWVKNQVTEHLLRQEWFKSIDDILKNPQTFEYIKNLNKTKLETLVWVDVANEILAAYWKIKIKQFKQWEEYSKVVTRINETKKANGEEEIKLNDYIEFNIEISVMELLKHSLITKKIFELNSRWDENSSYTWLYANMVWLAKNKWNDWAIISDENIDNAIDVSSTIAIAAVSMWVWAIAARWAMAAASLWARASSLSSKLASLWTKWKVAGFAWASTVEWYAFYQGYNTMNNIIYGNDILENAWNIKEIAKTVAFMWVLRWVWEVMKNARLANEFKNQKTWEALAFIWKMTDKVPAWILKNTWEILLKWWLISTTSVWLDYVFEWESDWTWEEYLQAVMLVWAMKWAKKNIFKRNPPAVTATEAVPPQTSWILEKIKNIVSTGNIPETAKKHIFDIAKTWAWTWATWLWLESWWTWYTWWYDEKTAIEITWDLISTFTKYAVIWWWLRTIYLWWVWAINAGKKVFQFSSNWANWVISSKPWLKLIGATIIWWIAYNVYSD